MDFTKTALAASSAIGIPELLHAVEELRLEDILGVVGLERRPNALARVLPALGLITVSAAVGAGLALLLAPSSGSKLRARLSDGLHEAKHRLSDSISHIDATRGASRHEVS
jgi:hypothetical protein